MTRLPEGADRISLSTLLNNNLGNSRKVIRSALIFPEIWSVIGPESLHHPLNQSDDKTKNQPWLGNSPFSHLRKFTRRGFNNLFRARLSMVGGCACKTPSPQEVWGRAEQTAVRGLIGGGLTGFFKKHLVWTYLIYVPINFLCHWTYS